MTGAVESPRRSGGRPRRSEAEVEQVRERIVAATKTEFSRVGYHGLTITRVIEHAGVTRTNFYHYYKHIDEPLTVVLERYIADLLAMIDERVAGVAYPPARVVAGVDAYLEWSLRYRDIIPSFFSGMYDTSSPVSVIRHKGMAAVRGTLLREYRPDDSESGGGYRLPPAGMLDLFVHTLEFACYRMHVETEATLADVAEMRRMMLRVATGLLGEPRDLRQFADWLESGAAEGRPEARPEA